MSQATVEVERAELPRALTLAPEAVVWAGPACAAGDAPLLAVRVPRTSAAGEALHRALSAGDAVAVDAAVAVLGLPSGLLDAMAERCLALARETALCVATGRAGTDGRWRKALASDAAASGAKTGQPPPWVEPGLFFAPATDMRVSHVRVLPSGRIALLEQWAPYPDERPKLARLWLLEPDGARRSVLVDMALAHRVSLSLLVPSVHADPSAIILAAAEGERDALALHSFAEDGTHVRSWFVKAQIMEAYSRIGNAIFLHSHYCHVAFDADDPRHLAALEPLVPAVAPPAPKVSLRPDVTAVGGATVVGHHLAVFSSEELVFHDLTLREPARRVPFARHRTDVRATEGALWLGADDGIYRATPANGLEHVAAEPARSLLVKAPGELLFGGAHDDLVCLDLASGRERFRTRVGHSVWSIAPAPGGGTIASAMTRFTWLDAAGVIRASSSERRDVGLAAVVDGTLAVSAGEEVIVIGADGALRRRLSMPYDGQIVGATATHFIYGVISGGWQRTEPDAISALDADGNVTARISLARTARGVPAHFCPSRLSALGGEARDTGTVAGDDLFILDANGALRRWDTAPPAQEGTIDPPAVLREARNLRSEKGGTYNPLDDWPEPGVDVASAPFFASECTYGGTTGVSAGPAILVRDGAVATLYRCRLVTGDRGQLQQASTAVLIACTLEADGSGQWQLEPNCHLVLIDCKIPSSLQIVLGEGASVIAPGLALVRERVSDRLERVTLRDAPVPQGKG